MELTRIKGLRWLHALRKVHDSLPPFETLNMLPQGNQSGIASTIMSVQSRVFDLSTSLSPSALRAFRSDALTSLDVNVTPHSKNKQVPVMNFKSKILLECINLVTNHPFLHRLWVQFHRSASNLHWSMISDQECHTFCTETLGYAANLKSACTIHQSWWEPNEPWWHTWQHLIQPDAVWGVSASSVGASLGAFGGPTSKYELSYGALPLHEVVFSARLIVYLAQPGVTTDEFSSLLTSSQHVEVIILGVPQCDEHWMTFAAQLTQTGIAFCAYEEKLSQSQPYGSSTRSRHSLRSFRAPCVSLFFITRDTLHSTRQPNGFVFCAPPFDMHLYIASLSTRSKHGRGTWSMPPKHCYQTVGKGLIKCMLLESLRRLQVVRQHLYLRDTNYLSNLTIGQKLSAHLDEMRALLKYTNYTWIRRIIGVSKALYAPFDKTQSVVYVVFSLIDGTVYVGRTGRSIVERFIEHLNGGIRAAFHLRRGEPEFLDGLELYAAMARHGIENFLILPLQVSTPERLPSVERRWIKFFGKHVYNTRDVSQPCHLRWRFFKRIPASSEVLHRQRVKTTVGQLLSNHRRVNMSVPALLDLMCESQSMVTRAHWIELWRIVKLKIHQRTGVHIPRELAIPYAASNETPPMSLTHFVKSTIMQAPLPLPLRHYLCSVTRLQAVGGKRVRDLLCTTRINVPWKRLCHIADQRCGCAHVRDVTKVQGCVCTRLHADWVTLFGPDATILKQHMGNKTITPWQSLSARIDRSASSVIRVSHMAEGVKGQWRETYMTRCADEYTTLASTIPWYLDPTLIQAFRRKWGGTYTFLMVDKNSGRTWVMCRHLFLRYVRLLYQDDVQFETLHTLPTVKAAKQVALDMLLQSATEAGLAPFLQRGPSFGVPCSFVFVKNKSNELIAELKWRILFSHFHHPLKKYGQRVGRALSLLIKAVVQVFDTWAILNTGDVREFAGRVESSLSKLYPDGILPKKRPRLFELDVKEMFPRLPRDGVISAITSLASELTLFLKTPPPPRRH